jgi:hypothetical protein
VNSRLSNSIKYPEWQNAYLAAITEEDTVRLKQKLSDAEVAIFRRQQALASNSSHSLELRAEHIALQDAIEGLRRLQQEKLKFPEWK